MCCILLLLLFSLLLLLLLSVVVIKGRRNDEKWNIMNHSPSRNCSQLVKRICQKRTLFNCFTAVNIMALSVIAYSRINTIPKDS